MDTALSGTSEFDLPVDGENDPDPDPNTHPDAEAALEALRAAINQDDYHTAQVTSVAEPPETEAQASINSLTVNQQKAVDKALAALSQLSTTNQTILDNMNIPGLIQGLVGSLELLVKSSKRQTEIVKVLHGQLMGSGSGAVIDPSLAMGYVPRSQYEELKSRYENLLSSNPGSKQRTRPRRSVVNTEADEERRRDIGSATPFQDESMGMRKRRSIKLEHLVHKMANRRLGVEYTIANFETAGARDLPDPQSTPPTKDESVTGVDEFRPDFRGDSQHHTVAPYLDAVVHDVVEAWEGGVGNGEPEVDLRKITEAVLVYWSRLGKRYDEQLAKDRGEVHKDELTRRKQNQYRRQQSLLARRMAAFNQSPLNVCKLRALYRSLLTIDFAAPTNERPDPKRAYSEVEWYAYQKNANGGRAPEAHEVVDQFWLSPTARALLVTLDMFSIDQATKGKRKGRPKQPAPTFHLPYELWDKTSLPILRPKDSNGLPVAGAAGSILFRFHVSKQVQLEHPEWARGLYDNPPLPDEDALLPSLPEVMNASVYSHLRPRVKAAREAISVPFLTSGEVAEINSRPPMSGTDNLPDVDTPDTSFDLAASADIISRNLDSLFALSTNPFIGTSTSTTTGPPNAGGGLPDTAPSTGTSLRARKQNKRFANELPGGAATPVPKRRRGREGMEVEGEGDEENREVEGDLQGDGAFLQSL